VVDTIVNHASKLIVTAVLFFLSFEVFAQNTIRTRNYTCNELRQLVRAEGQVRVRGLFGVPTIILSNPRDCFAETRAIRSTWRTKNVFFCRAGFICKVNSDDDIDDN